MTMTISVEEENRLYGISVLPCVTIFATLGFYYGFAHLTYLPSGTSIMWDALWNFVVPVLALAPASMFLTYEILASRKKKSIVLHVKRFTGRMALIFITGSLFIVIYVASYFLLAPLISERFAMLFSLLMWLMALVIGLAKSGGFLSKLEKGIW